MNITPIHLLNPIAQKQILATLRKYTFEDHVLALILKVMLQQLDEEDQRIPYVQKGLRALGKISNATKYVSGIVDATNKIWGDTYAENKISTSIAGFAVALIFKRPKQFKKIGLNIKHFQKLNKVHGVEGHTMQTLKIVNIMLEKLEIAKEKDLKEIAEAKEKGII